MPALHDVEKQEIRPVVQKIVKPVLLGEGDRAVHRATIQGSFDMRILIGKDKLGMIEIDLETQILFFIEEISKPVIVLGDG